MQGDAAGHEPRSVLRIDVVTLGEGQTVSLAEELVDLALKALDVCGIFSNSSRA
jgi:hypothetical protein